MISLSKNRNVFYTINENGSICETLIRRSIENVYYLLVESDPKPKYYNKCQAISLGEHRSQEFFEL